MTTVIGSSRLIAFASFREFPMGASIVENPVCAAKGSPKVSVT
jgi:hypothetical protein